MFLETFPRSPHRYELHIKLFSLFYRYTESLIKALIYNFCPCKFIILTSFIRKSKIFRFHFDLPSLRLSAEHTSLFLSPKFRERKSKKFNSVRFSLRIFVNLRVTSEKGRIFVAFKVLVHSWSTTYTAISSHYGSLLLLNLQIRLDGCQAPLLKIPQALLLKILQIQRCLGGSEDCHCWAG